MVGADDLVASGDIGAGPKKQRSIAGHVFKKPIITVGHHLHMFRGDIIGHSAHFIIAVTDDHLTIIPPTGAGGLGCGQYVENTINFSQSFMGQLGTVGDQYRRGIIPMFGLPQ